MASTGEVWKLGHRPALDGVRGIAVLLVLTTHLRIPGFGLAPAVGVVVFFALSGFLITTLLLERREALRRFYLRRAARLMPALAVCLVLYVGLQLAVTGSVRDGAMIFGAVTYTSNVLRGAGLDASDSGLGHLWSLAIEEQFYLLWPAAIFALWRLPRRWLLAVLAVGVAASLAARLYWWETVGYLRAYNGFDSRADELLIGCLLAVGLHGAHSRRLPQWPAAVFLAAAVAFSWTGEETATRWMPTAVALLTAASLFVLVSSEGRLFTSAWLRWFGRRSYAIYLYHLPIRWAVEHYVTDWRVVAPVVLVTTLLLAEVSWRLVERPVLGHSLKREPAVAAVGRSVEGHAGPAVLVHAKVDVIPGR